MSKFLITGGAGFIGSNYLCLMVNKYPKDIFVCLDALTYAGNLDNIKEIRHKKNFKFVKGNICNKNLVDVLFKKEKIDYVINFAAESHVDRSLKNPKLFYKTNIDGTRTLLDTSIIYKIKRFCQISTDEVYGPNNTNKPFKETHKLNPTSPYAKSKAEADKLVLEYKKKHKLSIVITRSSNNYGIKQHEEKLVPMAIKNSINNKKINIYGDGSNRRNWLYVDDNCKVIDYLIRHVKDGIYNISSNIELSNLQLVKLILKKLNKPESLIYFSKDRPNDDIRYYIDCIKLHRLFKIKYTSFVKCINKTIKYYK